MDNPVEDKGLGITRVEDKLPSYLTIRFLPTSSSKSGELKLYRKRKAEGRRFRTLEPPVLYIDLL